MDTINITEVEQATLEFVKGKSAADIGYAIALLRAYQSGQGAAVVPQKRPAGRPEGSRNRKAKSAPGGQEVQAGSAK